MYQFLSPKTLEEAKGFLEKHPKLKILAGGTDLIIGLREGLMACDYVMDVKQIPELGTIQMTEEGLEIGAGISVNGMMASGLLAGPYQGLYEAGMELANSLLRNRATLVGNICHASPGGDLIPACLVLDASVQTITPTGGRRLALGEFFKGPKRHVLAPSEMVEKIILPKTAGKSAYRKKKRIRGHDLAQVGVAGFLGEEGTLKLAFGACGPTPICMDLGRYDPAAREAVLERAMAGISPIGDVRASKAHREAMARYLAEQVLDALEV